LLALVKILHKINQNNTKAGKYMNQPRILPFYMAYPLPMFYQEEDTVTRDLEYLQQMYPAEAKKYQAIIRQVLDQMDYEGSMIYDEYPDKWQIYRLTQIIVDKIKKQQETVNDGLEEFVQVLLSYEIYKKRHTNHNGILKF
jgi:hypothetical protein